MNPELQSAIGQGAALKHAETVDKSAPQIENVTVKKVDRSSFLEEVAKPHELKHAETVDKSGPAIPGTTLHCAFLCCALFHLFLASLLLAALPRATALLYTSLCFASSALSRSFSQSHSSLHKTEDVHVKKVDRGAFLSEIEKAAKQ
jgi:hypothetical protein